MLTISKPQVGAIAFGRSGVGHIITALEADRVVLKCSDGLKRVPLTAVIRWELPRPLEVGDRVRLKNTERQYTITELYDHFMGLDSNDERTYEQWARLKTDDGKPANWKLRQLEKIS